MSIRPSLIIPGAMKAGSTSVALWIGSLEGFDSGRIKEPNIFTPGTASTVLTFRSLLNYGFRAKAIRVDGTTEYGKASMSDACAAYVSDEAPGARVLFLVRDPIDRSLSHYRHDLDRGVESQLDIAAGITETSDYVRNSQYRRCIAPWLSSFGEDLLVLNTDRLFGEDPLETAKLLNLLDLPVDTKTDFPRLNAAGSVTNVRRARQLSRAIPGYSTIRPLIPSKVRGAAVRAAGASERTVAPESVPHNEDLARKRLSDLLEDEIAWVDSGCPIEGIPT